MKAFNIPVIVESDDEGSVVQIGGSLFDFPEQFRKGKFSGNHILIADDLKGTIQIIDMSGDDVVSETHHERMARSF